MEQEHPNLSVLARLDIRDIGGSPDLFTEDVVFHFFNRLLPDLQGDHVGVSGIEAFFAKLATLSDGSFGVEPLGAMAIGDELVVAHTRNRMTIGDRAIELDALTVWRILGGRIAEVWDIPAVNTAKIEQSVRTGGR